MKPPPTITVSEFNQVIKTLLESEILLQNITITGEISNLREYKLGAQVYFNLIDKDSQLNCVLYDTFQKNIKFPLKNGIKVNAKGKLKVFHKKGGYTFQVSYLEEDGKGDSADTLEKLKAKLLKEGLFDPQHKKPIPFYPQHIALITAQDSAAFHDFTTILKAKSPHIKLTLIPTTMQGPKSPASIITALNLAETIPDLDLIVILRGGGSAEDLASHNDESQIRQIFATPTPIITAIGHEIDFTLSDFVSDHRSPTPTAAATHIASPYQNFKTSVLSSLKAYPQTLLNRLKDKKTTLLRRLDLANPLHKLSQGYSITTHEKTKKPLSISQLKPGDKIKTQLLEGSIISEVKEVQNDPRKTI